MKNVSKIANQIISTLTLSDLTSIKQDFSDIKSKTLELEKLILEGEHTSWEVIENLKPLAEQIIKKLEDITEKL